MTPFVWLQLIALSLLWGLAFVLVGAVVHDTGAFQVAWARIAGGALFMLLFCLAIGQGLRAGREFWLASAAMGLLNNILPFSLICLGQERIGPDLAAILNGTTPFFAAIAAHLFTGDERLTVNKLAGIGIGIAAVAVLVGPAAWQAVTGSTGDGLLDRVAGQVMVLAAACSYAAAGIYGKRFRGRPPVQLATAMLCMSAVMMTPVMLLAGADTLLRRGPADWLALAALGIASTGLAYILYFRILAAAGATNVLLVTLLVPFSTAGLGAALLGVTLTFRAALALALITLGLLIFDGRPVRIFLKAVRARLGQAAP